MDETPSTPCTGAPTRAAEATDPTPPDTAEPNVTVGPGSGSLSRIASAIALTLVFCGLEGWAGHWGHSSALVADAVHNLIDAAGLVALGLTQIVSRRAPSARFTFGLRNTSILFALLNSSLLLGTTVAISVEAARRLMDPLAVSSDTLMAIAVIGLLVNGASALLLAEGREHDTNQRVAMLHMLADAGVSFGLLIGGAAIHLTGWSRIDPIVGLLVGAFVLRGAWPLFEEAVGLALAGVPPHVDPSAVRRYLETRPGVSEVHELHIWPIGTTETALTCHIVVPGGFPGDDFVETIHATLRRTFHIERVTLQIEIGRASTNGANGSAPRDLATELSSAMALPT